MTDLKPTTAGLSRSHRHVGSEAPVFLQERVARVQHVTGA